jgi:hypothetical protein
MASCSYSASSSSRHTSCSRASSSPAPADTDLFPNEDENEQENEQHLNPPQVPMGAYLELGDEPLLIASPPLSATSDDPADVRFVPLLAPLLPPAARPTGPSAPRPEPTATLNDLLNCEPGSGAEECPICREEMRLIIHRSCGNGVCERCLLLCVDEKRNQRLPATCPFCRGMVNRGRVGEEREREERERRMLEMGRRLERMRDRLRM